MITRVSTDRRPLREEGDRRRPPSPQSEGMSRAILLSPYSGCHVRNKKIALGIHKYQTVTELVPPAVEA
jgi:hypothetical protein